MPEELLPEKPLAIVGDEDAVVGFLALGFKVYPVKDPQDFKINLAEILQNKIAVCLVQDDIYQEQQEIITSYQNQPLPVFIPFIKTAKIDLIDEMIREIRLRATGAF